MSERIFNSILIYRRSDIVSGLFYFFVGVTHSDSDSGMFQHGNIISPVAESHGLGKGNSEMGEQFVYACLFTASLRDDIAEQGCPAGRFTVNELWHNQLLLRGGIKAINWKISP